VRKTTTLGHLLWEQEIGSSNLSTPTLISPSIVKDRGIFLYKKLIKNTLKKTTTQQQPKIFTEGEGSIQIKVVAEKG